MADSDFEDPFEMLGGMGQEEVYKVTLMEEATVESPAEPVPGSDLVADDSHQSAIGALPHKKSSARAPKELCNYLRQLELLLLDPEAVSLVPEAPSDLEKKLKADAAQVASLVIAARGGALDKLFQETWCAPLSEALSVNQGDLPSLRSALAECCSNLMGAAACPEIRSFGLLLVAICSLQLYLRANWTGPSCDWKGPFRLEEGTEANALEKSILDDLEMDGEPAYELLVGAGYLWLSLELLGLRDGDLSPEFSETVPIWRSRASFVWQQSLAEASERGLGQSPSLFERSICDLVGQEGMPGSLCGPKLLDEECVEATRNVVVPVLQSMTRGNEEFQARSLAKRRVAAAEAPACVTALSEAPERTRAALIVELLVRLCWYGRTKPFEALVERACDVIDFMFQITGVMGIKRVYQTVEFAQLMVRAGRKSRQDKASLAKGIKGSGEAAATPGNLKLLEVDDMTDVMEAPKVSDSVSQTEKDLLELPLSSTEHVLLLARCHYLWVNGNPNDELLLQEVNALAQRIVVTEKSEKTAEAEDGPLLTANWLSFSGGLFYRCRAEHHRNKTRERAAFQLQSLVDQFKDEKPSAAHRLLLAHSAGYPARFHMQREMGMRMMRMGMVSTAHEQFKKLRMWPEAVDCLMVAERNVEAIDMVKDLLEKSPSPRLWCCLGDLEREPAHFEKAWELSNKRYARAQRSLGRHYFSKEQLDKAVDAFKLALDINPLHPGVWFTMGVAEMRLQRWEDASHTFSRCLGIEDENSEGWANLAAVHSQLGNLQQARTCMSEACKRARESWKMWESFLGICMQLRDIQGVIQALRRMTELDQGNRIPERVLGMVTMAIATDATGLYEGRTGKAFSNLLNDLFKYMADRFSSRAFMWRFWAALQDSRGENAEAFESRLKQNRVAQSQLWEEPDPERFTTKLSDLRECFKFLAESLADPDFAEASKSHRQPLLYSLQDAIKRLTVKVEAPGGALDEWKADLAALKESEKKIQSLL